MNKYIILAYLLFIFIALVSCDDDAEEVPDDGCSSLSPDKCHEYESPEGSNGTKQCIFSLNEYLMEWKCHLKTCEDLNMYYCSSFTPIGTGENRKKCLLIDGECKLKKCSELEKDICFLFNSHDLNDSDYQCIQEVILNEEKVEEIKDYCKLQKCSDLLPSQCGSFYYNNKSEVCFSNKNKDGCELKTCTELDPPDCSYISFDDYNCMENESGDACELKKCEDMKEGECHKFHINSEYYQCLEIETEKGKKCSKLSCADFKPPNCKNFTPKSELDQCLPDGDKCIEKACNDFHPPNCGNFIPNDNNLQCKEFSFTSDEGGYCSLILKECEQLDSKHCFLSSSNCIQNEDQSGCKLLTCEATDINSCEEFIPYNDNEKCVYDSQKNKCNIIRCQEFDISKCNNFIPNDKSKKCTNNEGNCIIDFKKCEEFSIKECQYCNPLDDDLSCLPDEENNKCILTTCESMPINACSNFTSRNKNFQCLDFGESCSLVACSDMPKNTCDKFIPYDFDYKCIPDQDFEGLCYIALKSCGDYSIDDCKKGYALEFCKINKKGDKCIDQYEIEIEKDIVSDEEIFTDTGESNKNDQINKANDIENINTNDEQSNANISHIIHSSELILYIIISYLF